MEKKEYDWFMKKAGHFSASKAKDLLSKSGSWTKGNISYIMEIAYQRKTGRPMPSVSSRTLKMGIENEPMAVDWLRENTDWIILHCDTDFDEKIFDVPFDDVMFGVSPDAFKMSMPVMAQYNKAFKSYIEALIEIKCVVGRERELFYFSDEYMFEEKRKEAFIEHGEQLAAQMLAYPTVQKAILLKYLPQSDFDEFDMDSPLDPSRGLVFEYTRDELSELMSVSEKRVRYADAWIKSGKTIRDIH